MKACFKCGVTKPLEEFYKHARMADGHLNKCKECTKSDVHQHRHGAGREQVLQYDRLRAQTPKRVSARKRIVGAWRKENPERYKAHAKVNYALRAGDLVKWPTCALPDCNHAPEAHHPDYSRPLDVVWLCPAHHKQAHALARN